MKILLTIKENWKDPVWSKVIAAVIISAGSAIFMSLYAFIKAIIAKISIEESFDNIGDFLNNYISMRTWIFSIFVVLYLILISKQVITLIENIIFKIKNPKEKIVHEIELESAPEHSTAFFSSRMSSAFPGIRDITWFDNPVEAIKRLEILLRAPLRFKSGHLEHEVDPIWWFRGDGALFIDKFIKTGRKKVLLDKRQLKIKRIAAYHGDSYYKDFVYVEVEGEKQTGLENLSKEDIERHIKSIGYSYEEYGIIKNCLGWKILIKREDYDDGATVRRGKVINALNAELRVRFLSSYNFIIAAKGSPYNSQKFNEFSAGYFNKILKNEINADDFFNLLKKFIIRER